MQIEREAERTHRDQKMKKWQTGWQRPGSPAAAGAIFPTKPVMVLQEKTSKSPETTEIFHRLLDALDKPLRTETINGIKYVYILGKRYTASGFRGICQLLDRCFCCGGNHRSNECKRRNNPLFLRPPGFVDRKTIPNDSSKRPSNGQENHKPVKSREQRGWRRLHR